MTRDEFMNVVYGELHSDGNNYRANRIIDAADCYAEDYAKENEPHWIPVTKALPKKEGFYLVTLAYKTGTETNTRYFKIDTDGECYWSKWGNEDITAWMPKPIPYQPQKEVTEGDME